MNSRAMMIGTIIGTALMAVLGVHSAGADLRSPNTASPCDPPAFHALDFFVGDWDVYDTAGKLYAHQSVKKDIDGCVLVGHWIGPVGDHGLTVLAFDPTIRRWKGIYSANHVPSLIPFITRTQVAAYAGKGVRLSREVDPAKPHDRDQLTIEPIAQGRVRYHYEVSSDDGRTWKTIFDAQHRPAAR